jgi:hypothetical protein
VRGYDASVLVVEWFDKIKAIDDTTMLEAKELLLFSFNVANGLAPPATGADETMEWHQNARHGQRGLVDRLWPLRHDSDEGSGGGSTGSSCTACSRSAQVKVADEMRECILKIDALLFSDGRCNFMIPALNSQHLVKMHALINGKMTPEYFRIYRMQMAAAAAATAAAATATAAAAEIRRLQQALAGQAQPPPIDAVNEEKLEEV